MSVLYKLRSHRFLVTIRTLAAILTRHWEHWTKWDTLANYEIPLYFYYLKNGNNVIICFNVFVGSKRDDTFNISILFSKLVLIIQSLRQLIWYLQNSQNIPLKFYIFKNIPQVTTFSHNSRKVLGFMSLTNYFRQPNLL